jgi:hypothetical protein
MPPELKRCGSRNGPGHSQWLEEVQMRSLILASIVILMKIEQIMIRRIAKRGVPR